VALAASGLPVCARWLPRARKSCSSTSTPTGLPRLRRELGADRSAFVAADVADAEQTRKYVGETVARWGKIDVLFSNAGNDGP
jgi:NAD(P)-dependent dehydrogenase (short-subunit alcohol dehydrogenase family)